MNKQLLQRALDALEKNLQSLVVGVTFDMTQAAIAELRAAIDAVAPCHMPDAGNMVAQPATWRARFEQAALQRAIQRRQEGNVIDDNGCDITHETLFWKDANCNYGIHMFNAAWWGWKSACEAMTPKEVPSGNDFIRRTNEDYAAWCKTQCRAFALDARGFPSVFGLWAWQEQERRKQAEVCRLNEEEHQSQLHLERALRAAQNLKDRLAVLSTLLSEVSEVYTREDDLPDGLLPRIEAALAPVTIESDATKL